MDFEPSARTKDYLERLERFMREHIDPVEARYREEVQATCHGGDWKTWKVPAVMEELKARAKAAGLWNLFLPDEKLGAGLSVLEYAPLAERMGRSFIAPEVFNCSAPDTGNMEVLWKYGSEEQKARWLTPLLAGEIRSVFCMTEPEVASSDATNMQATAVVEGNEIVLNGGKWWSSGLGHPKAKIIIFMALASTILGGVAAIGQKNIKRLLAYSSINNVGFALVGLAAAGVAGVASVLFYMAVYIVMTLGAFLCVQRMRNEAGEPVEGIDSLSGLSQTRPGLAAAFAIFMFSLAGIPPLFGFWPKLMVFNAAVAEGLYPLAVAGILGTVIGAFYYLKIIKAMYRDAPAEPYAKSGSGVETAFIALAAIAVSPLGYLLIGPLGQLTQNAAGSLF